MQATEPATSVSTANGYNPDLDMLHYLPDWLRPLWDALAPYPGVLTLFLVIAAWAVGWLLKLLIKHSLERLTSRTASTTDDHLVAYLTQPIAPTMVTLALMLAVTAFELPPGLHNATLSLLATILLLLWTRAGLRTARIVLELVGNISHRFEIIQERTIPLFDMSVKVLIVGASAYFFLLIWGIDPTAWLASAGVIGIAVGFAARDSLANLFAGIFIVADAPYKIGDYIVLGTGERGEVTGLGMRSTRLLTRDDVEVTIPNAVIANAKIVNESGGPSEKQRIRVPVGVAYGSDADEVCKILEEVAKEHPDLARFPAPAARMRAFGASSLDFELRVWIDHPQLRGRVRHDLLKAIYRAFIEHGIEIPFPQSDVHVRSMPGDFKSMDD